MEKGTNPVGWISKDESPQSSGMVRFVSSFSHERKPECTFSGIC